ncbi:MAG: hypothetical protein EXS58_06830 [Candidatus Latescibacteria bacterium]|nr:hypothetical protein [Candidatus Latescibacterota bacterium]
MTATRQSGQPLAPEQSAAILDRFYREGFAYIPGILSAGECAQLRERVDRAFDAHPVGQSDLRYGEIVLVRLFELDTLFRDLLVREPIIGLCDAVLGPQCHLFAQNLVRNGQGQAIDRFHVDDEVEFPLPDEIPRHDARLRLSVFRMTVQILLSDVEAEQYGPTQFVPGSHYSGRNPSDPLTPSFEGQGPVSILGRAGDIYLHNGQCWHRGAPNASTRVRYLLQHAMGRRWVAQRFYPFLNYHMPEHVLEGADERLLRVLGKHPKGPYG